MKYKTLSLPIAERDLVVTKYPQNIYMSLYDTTLTLAGKRYEITRYTRPISRTHIKRPNASAIPQPQPYKRRTDNINRAKKKLRHLVYTNVPLKQRGGIHPRFLMLSYNTWERGNPENHKQQAEDLTLFLQKLHKRYGEQKYVYVSEKQPESGRIHYHLLTFGTPFINKKEIEEMWGHGFVKIKRHQPSYQSAQKLSAYMAKYMGKEMHIHGKHRKSFGCSQNLEQPQKFIEAERIEALLLEAYLQGYRVTYKPRPYELPYHPDTWGRLQVWEPPD